MQEQNTTVTYFNLRFNNIGEEGLMALVQLLKINETLTSLNLYPAGSTGEKRPTLTQVLQENYSLTYIDLWVHNKELEYIIQRNQEILLTKRFKTVKPVPTIKKKLDEDIISYTK